MKWFLTAVVLAMVVAHHDFWNWSKVDPLLFGFLPIGLAYHAAFCIAASIVLAIFVIAAWPKHLEGAEPETEEARRAEGFGGH